MKEREKWIDISRGVAIVFVILGHLPLNIKIHSFIYSFHMPLFFIISGLFAFETYQLPFVKYIKKKYFRLIYPYLIFGLFIMIPFGIIINSMKNHTFSFMDGLIQYGKSILGHLIGLRGDWSFSGTYWFLPCLFCAGILIYLISKYTYKYTMYIIILFSFIGFLYQFYVGRSLPLSFDLSIIAILFMMIGSYYYHNQKLFTWSRCFILGILGTFAAVYNGKIEMYEGSFNNPLLFILSGTGISFLILKICTVIKNVPILIWLGTNSILIYMLHYLLRPVLSFIIVRLPGNDYWFINSFYCIIGVGIICILLWPIIKMINIYFPYLLGKFNA